MNQAIYDHLITTPTAPVQFLIDTHYADILARAESAGIVRGDVGRKALYLAVVNSAARPAVFKSIMDISPDAAKMPAGSQEALDKAEDYWKQYQSNSQPQMLRNVTTGNGGGGASGGSGSAAGGGFWNSDTTTAAVGALPDLVRTIGCLINPATCAPAPVVVGNNGPGQTPQAPPRDYTPWIIGAGVFVTLVIIGVIVYLRTKK